MFLLAEPKNRFIVLCTTAAISFTNIITSYYNTSIVSLKFLISQNPKTQCVFFPGIIGSMSPPLLLIFVAIISAPASPNPSANNAPILTIVCSKNAVSNGASFSLPV